MIKLKSCSPCTKTTVFSIFLSIISFPIHPIHKFIKQTTNYQVKKIIKVSIIFLLLSNKSLKIALKKPKNYIIVIQKNYK